MIWLGHRGAGQVHRRRCGAVGGAGGEGGRHARGRCGGRALTSPPPLSPTQPPAFTTTLPSLTMKITPIAVAGLLALTTVSAREMLGAKDGEGECLFF